ncbi:uncharacterized protein Nmlp_1162 [Natronomonas moolapensis 8.8.11]|uniref:Uncharacterized protein n=1 Tax=Natronomonas moolapensis (strain DSM 18674 / CECT 7526 / JCM 14361 / 8.8.11) TaxID=268739 RepID=M1XK71_NATM8|nr:hypothetical protein [Natronomonas moolapensis]CCQ35372.1 uncharacterized protein Nmlp_1162 [Natronomonas moolapensis 8.8.11]
MSSATQSRQTPSVTNDRNTAGTWIHRAVRGVRAAAFWTATVLPVLVVAALIAGTAGRYPAILGGVLALNVVCAVVGHGHSPGR